LTDVTIVNVAMPSIRTDLHASGGALQLIVSGYTVSYAMLLITGARLGDLYGRRRLFLAGVLGFTLSSLVCGLAPNVITLIVARFVQGGGNCQVEDTAVWITFGSANRALNLMFTDQALINLARVANKAVRAMLHARDILAPDTD
jgi:MFS family permease